MNTSPLEAAAYSIKHWYLPLLIGLVLLLLGVYVFLTPLASYLALSLIFSISFLVSGILEIAFSIVTLPFVVGFFLLFKSVNALAWAFDLKNTSNTNITRH